MVIFRDFWIRYVPYAAVGKVDDDKMTELLKALQDSKTVNMCYHVNDPQVGMGLSKNKDQFKMFVCDTGLFITLAFWDKSFTENIIYEKLWQTNYLPIWAMFMKILLPSCWWLQGMNFSTTLGHAMRNTTMRQTSCFLVEQRFVLLR